MICPVCANELKVVKAGDVIVDVCLGGCGGIWFDRFELQKVDDSQESAGEPLLYIERDESQRVDSSQRRQCPHCEDVIMMRHFASVKMEVEVDECPKCAGVWLDYGELARIRSQFENDEDRREGTRESIQEMFQDELAKASAQSLEELEKTRKFARMFRLLCPSYYLAGKQGWGAF